MRHIWLGIAGLTTLLAATPALAGGVTDASALPPDADVEIVPTVAPGDQIGIACDALEYTKANSDVRVVLTISAEPGETSPGYKKVMATDEQVANGAVRVRVPRMPDIQNHTVNLNVYVVDAVAGDSKSCDAGHVKIVNTMAQAHTSKHAQGQQS